MIEEFKTPGQLIQSLLQRKEWTQRVLAIVLGVDETIVNKLVADTRPVSAEDAVVLEEVFGVAAERFLELQKHFDLAKARITARPDPRRNSRAIIHNGLPVAEMIKRGWIDAENVKDPNVEASLAQFFGVATVDEIEIMPHAAKKTAVAVEATPAQLAWLYRVKQIASDMLVPKFSPQHMPSCIDQLSKLLSAPEEARKVPRILAEHGIRFVIVESLKSAKIDGVCFWLSDTGPVIGMSLRFDRIDNFWFVLRHECEHVWRGHGRAAAMLDVELEGDRAGVGSDVSSEERQANAAAQEFCVTSDQMNKFIARKSPLFAERDLLGFARTIGVHPGLIVGQLQHRTGRYDLHRGHLAKVRSAVAPSAIVDGWGDVAPVGH